MAEVLVDAATFDTGVTVPQDGDARDASSIKPAFQKLTNRGGYLKAHVDILDGIVLPYLQAAISGNNKANGAYYSLAAPTYNVGGFAIASDEVTFPAIGKYLVMATAEILSSGSIVLGMSHKNGVEVARLGTTGMVTAVGVCVVGIVDITNASTDRVKVASYVPGGGGGDLGTISSAPAANHLIIRRIG